MIALDHWHVWQPSPQRAACARLQMAELGYATFAPLYVQRNGVRQDLFPGYSFVRFDAKHDCWGEITHCRGFRRLLTWGDLCPCTVPEAEMGFLLGHALVYAPGAEDLTGAEVEVLSGPLARLRGVVSESGEARVRVLLSVLGREVSVALERAAVGRAA